MVGCSQTLINPTQLHFHVGPQVIQKGLCTVSSERASGKHLELEADHLPPSSAEVNA
jgi:hypothetical protein